MPDELLTLYFRETPDAPVSGSRSAYYDDSFGAYLPHHPAVIDVFLFNRYGDLLLQKRGRHKRFNAGRLHTTVGGHVGWGDTPAFTVAHECLDELGAPTLIFPKEEYEKSFMKLQAHLGSVALLCEVGAYFRNHVDDPIESRRDIKDRVWIYFGRYDGSISVPDRESAGYEWISLDDLNEEFAARPGQFTDGLQLFVENFGEDMREFVKRFSSV